MHRVAFAVLGCASMFGQVPIRFDDLPPAIAKMFDRATFEARRRQIETETAARERKGEIDHAIFYALQSKRFTSKPPIEPAVSAPAADVEARLKDFEAALAGDVHTPQLDYFRRLPKMDWRAEYQRVVRELAGQGQAEFYESRGHSTDTQLASSFTVWNALSVLRGIKPETRIASVLIIGPGLDFAPRTALDDSRGPQSYQPFAVAQAIRGLGMGDPKITCVDINQRVLDYFRAKPSKLLLPREPGEPPFVAWQRQISPSIATAAVEALSLNIVTERLERQFDLVVVTNVLLYFDRPQLALALTNMGAMLGPGGYLIHNEIRPEAEGFTNALGLRPVHARSVLIAKGAKAPLYDAFAIYQKMNLNAN